MAEQEPLPCPFCGEPPDLSSYQEALSVLVHRVMCLMVRCKVRPKTHWFPKMEDAIELWNTRATTSDYRREWQPMSTAPRNASWVIVLLPDGEVLRAHWAEGDGENQPSFRGWFRQTHESFTEIDAPIGWMPLPAPPVPVTADEER